MYSLVGIYLFAQGCLAYSLIYLFCRIRLYKKSYIEFYFIIIIMISRILVLVIASDSPAHYLEMQKVWTKWTYKQVNGAQVFDVWFVKAKPERLWIGDIVNDGPLSDIIEIDNDAMTIFVKGDETYIPGILNKTIEAIRYFDKGALPKGAFPEGAFPEGAFPEGAFPEGALPEGALPKGALPEGAFPEGASFDGKGALPKGASFDGKGALPKGALPKGTLPEGTLPEGALPEGALPEGALPKGFDYIWRTNLSSILDFDGLLRYIDSGVSGCYSGYIGEATSVRCTSDTSVRCTSDTSVRCTSDTSVRCTSDRCTSNTSDTCIRFASGSGFLLNRCAIDYLIENEHLLRRDLIDDVAIGALLEPRFGLTHIDRCWVDESLVFPDNVFHFRCETYQHLRTIEFMNATAKYIDSKTCKQIIL